MDIREFTGLIREFGFAGLGGWQGTSRRDKKLRKIRGLIEPVPLTGDECRACLALGVE
jgi:hypothetical protein